MRRHLWIPAAALVLAGAVSWSCATDTASSAPSAATKREALGASTDLEALGAPAGFERVTDQRAVASATVSFMDEAAKPARPSASLSRIKPAPGIPPRWRDAWARLESPKSEPTRSPASPSHSPDLASLALTASFNALKDDGSGIAPPDTNGAAGPNHLMVALNTTIQIESKTGTSVGASSTLAKFFATVLGPNDQTSDPHVIYDAAGQRWIFVAISYDGNTFGAGGILLAVSANTDPTGTWHLFKVPVDPTPNFLGDYPIVGFNKSWISVSLNLFDTNSNFAGARIFAFDKAAAYAGTGNGKHTVFTGAPLQVPIDAGTPDANLPDTGVSDAGDSGIADGGVDAAPPPPPPLDFSIAGAWTLDPAASSLYMLEDFDGTRGNLRLFQISGALGAETLTKLPDVNVSSLSVWADGPPTATNGNFVPQKGGVTAICANDSRFTEIVVRNGLIWAAHPVFLPCLQPDGNFGCGSGPDHVAAQWLVIDPTTSAIVHAGRQEDPTANQVQGTHYFFPSLMPNKFGDALFGFSQGGVGKYVSTGYAMRFGWDPPNTMRDPAIYKQGLATYDVSNIFSPRNRWGDYSITSADPSDDTTLWTIQEYAETPASTFGTWWGELSFACAGKADGAECDDGTVTDACTTETCQAGVCKHATRVCAPMDACHVAGTCDAASGCSNPPKVCASTNPCLTPSCSLTAGGCTLSVDVDGTVCAPASTNKCFASFSCQQAVCTGVTGVACTSPPDSCHEATGLCDPSTGTCAYLAKTDGGVCIPQAGDGGTDGGSPDSGSTQPDSGTTQPDSGATGPDGGSQDDSGSAGDAASDGGGGGTGQSSGCGCRVVDARGSSSPGLLGAGLLGMLAMVRARRRRGSSA